MATTTATETIPPAEPTAVVPVSFITQFRKFLWLSSGMFSASALSLAFLGYMLAGSAEGASTNFLAAVISACLFAIATLMKLGPDEA